MTTHKQDTPHPVDQTRRAIGSAALALLADRPFSDLTVDQVIAAADIDDADADLARCLYQQVLDMLETGLANIDADLAANLAHDVADDHVSTTREKIFEGLIQRFEAYRSYKPVIRAMNSASLTQPKIGLVMVNRLTHAMGQLLQVTGGGGTGIAGRIRAKGLAGICLSVLNDWLKDDTPDMAETIRMLDKRLQQGENLAITLRLITPEPDQNATTQTSHDGDKAETHDK